MTDAERIAQLEATVAALVAKVKLLMVDHGWEACPACLEEHAEVYPEGFPLRPERATVNGGPGFICRRHGWRYGATS